MRGCKVFPTNSGAAARWIGRCFFRVGSRLKKLSLDPALKIHGSSNGCLKGSFGRFFTLPLGFCRKKDWWQGFSFCGCFCLKCSFECYLEDFQLFVPSYLQLCIGSVSLCKYLIELTVVDPFYFYFSSFFWKIMYPYETNIWSFSRNSE